jgi:predicted ester cyclase
LLDEAAHFWFAGREALGPAAVVGHHAAIFGAFAQRQFKATRLLLAASAQAIEWTMTGTQTGPWQGLPASGKPVVIRGLSLVGTSDDGIITDIRMYFDQAVVKAQLGVGPADLLALPPATVSDAPPLVVEQPAPDHAATNAGVMRMMLQDLEDAKESDFLATFADDIQVFTQDRAEPMTGKQAARGYYRTLHKAIRQLDTVTENAWDVGQFAIVEYSITGVQRTPLGRIPLVPDRALNLRFTDIAEIHDGKITRIWRYDDLEARAADPTPATPPLK